MNTTDTQKIPWGKLPQQIRDILSAEETVETLEAIGAKYGLSDMEQGFLIRITSKLVSGALPPTEFVKSLIENIDISRDQAVLVAQEVNRDILNDIKDLLKELYEAEAKKSAMPIGVAPAPFVPAAKIPTAPIPTLAAVPPPIVKPAGEPVRSDWGWHGQKNESTGQIEFKHETLPGSIFAKSAGESSVAGLPHVGSIFEQKLGGSFTLKSEPQQPAGGAPIIPQQSQVVIPTKPSIEAHLEHLPSPGTSTLRIPKKPTQVPIPPIQIFQMPKS